MKAGLTNIEKREPLPIFGNHKDQETARAVFFRHCHFKGIKVA